jgi:hypothetical protein
MPLQLRFSAPKDPVKPGIDVILDVLAKVGEDTGDKRGVFGHLGPIYRNQQLKGVDLEGLGQLGQHRIAYPGLAAFNRFDRLNRNIRQFGKLFLG